MGIQEHTELDEFFDRVGRNSKSHDGIVVCRRILYGDPCGSLILASDNPAMAYTECDECGRLAVLCTGCSVLREGDTCAEFEPQCRFKVGCAPGRSVV